ncbi:MAG: RNA-binding S4 domain-containing protein [Betaproteobacteria bacterium]|nr:RNA-binding S4 domain-containing protein [Betaproteobacteria bacterium]
MTESSDRLRFDKWLWAARFFKTRTLAAQAIEGGRARLNEARVKSSRDVKCGDTVVVRAGELEWTLTVMALSAKRGPASEAALLYSEGEESRARRQLMLAMRRAGPKPDPNARGRPSKRDRRLIHKFTEG